MVSAQIRAVSQLFSSSMPTSKQVSMSNNTKTVKAGCSPNPGLRIAELALGRGVEGYDRPRIVDDDRRVGDCGEDRPDLLLALIALMFRLGFVVRERRTHSPMEAIRPPVTHIDGDQSDGSAEVMAGRQYEGKDHGKRDGDDTRPKSAVNRTGEDGRYDQGKGEPCAGNWSEPFADRGRQDATDNGEDIAWPTGIPALQDRIIEMRPALDEIAEYVFHQFTRGRVTATPYDLVHLRAMPPVDIVSDFSNAPGRRLLRQMVTIGAFQWVWRALPASHLIWIKSQFRGIDYLRCARYTWQTSRQEANGRGDTGVDITQNATDLA